MKLLELLLGKKGKPEDDEECGLWGPVTTAVSGSETLTVLVEDTNSGDVLFGLVKAAAEKMGLPEEVRLSDDKELAEKHETALPALIIDGKAFAISEGASVEEIVRIIEKA